MRQFRLTVIALITSLAVINAVFLRKTIAVLLCGVVSFNSTSCYSFLAHDGKADAAVSPQGAATAPKAFRAIPQEEPKIAGCFLGVCVTLPKIPVSIPSLPSGSQNNPTPPASPSSSEPTKPTATANPSSNVSFAGKWRSDWGPVEFNSNLTGSWNQGYAQPGQIKDGSYDPQTRQLVFHYYQPWNEMDGTATLTLSADGNQLLGTWTQQRDSKPAGSGGSGFWVMTRDRVAKQEATAPCQDKKTTGNYDENSIAKQWNEIGKILTNYYYLSNHNPKVAGFAHQMYNLYIYSFDEKSQKPQAWAGDFTRSILLFAANDIERRKDFWKDPPNIYKGFWTSLVCTPGKYFLVRYDCGAANAGENHFKEQLEPAFYDYIKSKLDLVATNSCPENLKNNLISSIKEIREEHIQLLNKAVIPGFSSVTEMSEYAREKAQEAVPTKATALRISTFSKVLLPLLEPGRMTEPDIREVEKEAFKP